MDSNNKVQPTVIKEADFFTCEFISCRFRGTFLETVDFRYSSFTDCSLGGCHIKYGDFYMASFKGTTNFIGSILSRCSLTNASFENNLPRIDSIDGLVQEYYQDYSDIIICHRHWHKLNPCADFSCMNEAEDKNKGKAKSEAYIRKEAGEVYAQLSGFYAGKGLYMDSNRAYERAKNNEARAVICHLKEMFSPDTQDDPDRPSAGQLVLNLLEFCLCWLLGYGYKLRNILVLFLLLVVVYTGFFNKSDGSGTPWYDALAYSVNNSMGPYEKFASVVGEALSCTQSTIGILLLGFLGFVVANRIRNNY